MNSGFWPSLTNSTEITLLTDGFLTDDPLTISLSSCQSNCELRNEKKKDFGERSTLFRRGFIANDMRKM